MVLKHPQARTVLAARVVSDDQVRFLEPRSDGKEFYVVGRVDRVYRDRTGSRVIVVDGDSWKVAETWEIELI